jgi:hypothetical protein
MKTKHAVGLLASFALATIAGSLKAQPTNLVLYNFDTDQVTSTGYGSSWNKWFGGYFQSVTNDPTMDAGNNTNSGSMKLTLNCTGSDQYVLFDGYGPTYAPVDLTVFTNLSFDIRYDISSAIRTNTVGAGINGSQGTNSLDFGYMRVGSKSQPSSTYNQDWYYYFSVPATNGAGLPNTNWVHISADLRQVTVNFSDLSVGLADILFGMDGGGYGNSAVVGPQIIWFDNITLHGYVAPAPPPRVAIRKAAPALRLFGGSGQYGRSQLTLVDTSESWVGGTFPVSYSFTMLDNATSPGALDAHIQIIPNAGNYSGSDYTLSNALWLQIISGTGTNTACVANLSWKTNAPSANPNQTASGRIELMLTNPVLAGTWTLTFNSDTNGTLTAPGASPVPFTLLLADADVMTYFSNPVQLRFGIQNFGNVANGGVPHDWSHISVSGTVGTQVNEDFTRESTAQLDTSLWNLNTSDGAGGVNLVPTNAPYWITWAIPDGGFGLGTSTNLSGPWFLPEFYNSYADGTTSVGTQTTQAGVRWNLMLPQYLPTSDGTVGGPLSPNAFFRLSNPPPPQ